MLKKGVHVHSFSDLSGSVFINTYSGETLSIKLSLSDVTKFFSSTQQGFDKSDIEYEVTMSLVSKGFLNSFDALSPDVE